MKIKKANFILLFTLLLCLVFPLTGRHINFNTQDRQDENSSNPIVSDVVVGNYTIPGISVPIPLSQVIKIGILNDMNDISGDHSWKGAFLAAKEINEAGGVLINSTYFYIGLVAEDTDEANPNLVTAIGVNAAHTMVNYHEPHFIVGGFRAEALLAYQEVIMDAKIPFISTGTPTDIFCDNVLNDYSHYKYFFRVLPINATSSAAELLYYYAGLAAYLNATYGFSSIKFGILHEDLTWCTSLVAALTFYLPFLIPGSSIVETIAFPVTLTEMDMVSHLMTLETSGAQIVIPLISASSGIFMGTQYGILKPPFLLAGLNRHASYDGYWDYTRGGGQYEIVMQEVFKTNKTELTIPFWDSFVAEFGSEPFYTGTGSYDAVKLLVNSTIETQSFNSDKIIENLEKINSSNPFVGASGNIAFSWSHDLVEGWPYGYNLFCQWQMDGTKEVIPSWGLVYPNSIVTGSLSIPYWGIDNIVEDFSHELPGDFILYSDADDQDTDGAFDLSWTASDGADSYSLYLSDDPITYISKTHTLLQNNNSISPYSISGLKSGDYYFAVVSYNETGQKFSNSEHITVQLPKPGNFTLTSDADETDTDGAFDLSWTASDGADNYSVYTYDKFISEFNESLAILADQNATSPFPISGLSDGVYYYVVIAYNGTGQTMSNCINITVDFPPPGDFILTSDADYPDKNGIFYLSWTDSDGADNYSIYSYNKFISEINGSLISLAHQTALSPFLVTHLLNGEFYYVAVAYNETGQTLSTNVHVTIQISESGNGDTIIIIPGYDILWLISILSLVSLFVIKKTLFKDSKDV